MSALAKAAPKMTVNANQLRKLSEWADGKRGEHFVISMNVPLPDGTSGFGLRALETGEQPNVNEFVIFTDKRIRDKQIPTEVIIRHPDANEPAITVNTSEFDALFWGTFSAERLLVPYYVRFFDEAQMNGLRGALASPEFVAYAHSYPTDFHTVGTAIQAPCLRAAKTFEAGIKRAPDSITIRHQSFATGAITISTREFDSVFWGEVSTEKFLVPYYAAFLDHEQMKKLRRAVANPDVIAFAQKDAQRGQDAGSDEPFVLVSAKDDGTIAEFVRLSEWRS